MKNEQSASKLAEYYFEYKITKVFGEDNLETPKLYFERDYRNPLVYCLYAVVDEWINDKKLLKTIQSSNLDANVKNAVLWQKSEIKNQKENKKGNSAINQASSVDATFKQLFDADGKKHVNAIRSVLPFDEINVVFDINGIEASDLSNKQGYAYKNAEIRNEGISVEKYWESGCRLVIDKEGGTNHSGVGEIEYKKRGEVVAKYYFAINFTMRKKIYYTLVSTKDKVSLRFECKDMSSDVMVNLTYAIGRLPCLRNDARLNVVDSFNLAFDKGGVFKKEISIAKLGLSTESALFSVSFKNTDMDRYFLLVCTYNSGVKKDSVRKTAVEKLSCPYCHRPVNASVKKDGHYMRGGISCQGPTNIQICSKNGREAKRAMYCAEDVKQSKQKNLVFQDEFKRLLPYNFLEHKSFKIAFTGSKRAGKTTYITRLFDIGEKGVITAHSIAKIFEHINTKIAPATIIQPKDEESKSGESKSGESKSGESKSGEKVNYFLSDNVWSCGYYEERALSLEKGLFPSATNKTEEKSDTNFRRYPFCLEVDKTNYVSFYDIAGEDAAERGMGILQGIAGDEPIGVFLLINGNKDSITNDKVIKMLKAAKLNPNCPVAVILTKSDMIREAFDSNCYSLRTDYLNFSHSKYTGSILETKIDFVSEEIRSYLVKNSLDPLLEGDFKNVKYFSVSAFNSIDSIHNPEDNADDVGRLRFASGSTHLELPLIWMMKQFGIIE